MICRGRSVVIESSSNVRSSRSAASERKAVNGTITNSGNARIM
jgi:hypothetical protein